MDIKPITRPLSRLGYQRAMIGIRASQPIVWKYAFTPQTATKRKSSRPNPKTAFIRTDPNSPMKNIALPPIRSPRKPFTSFEAAYTAK